MKRRIYGRNGCLVKERIGTHKQHIRQRQYQQLVVEEHLRTCGDGKFHKFLFSRFFKKINYLKDLMRIIS